MFNQIPVDGGKRNFLTELEVRRLLGSARRRRHGTRDYLMVLLTYRHGLRVSELVDIRIRDLDLDASRIHVRRRKGSLSTVQPIEGDELRAIRAYLRERDDTKLPYLLLGERGPLTRQAVNYLFKEIGQRAELTINIYPHMLRHSTGYYLANKGYDTRLIQDYLGHKNITHTVKYTRTAASRFEGLWR